MAPQINFEIVVGPAFQEPLCPLQIVGDSRQGLVELVGKGRRHFAHRRQAGNMDELGLQFLQARLGLLPFGQVADEARKETLVRRPHFADRQFHRECGAVFPFSDNDAPDADDPALPGPQIALQIAVVTFTIGRGHEHLDVLADDFVRAVSEQPLRGNTERLHDPALVDHDHGVGNGFQDRLEVRFARSQILFDQLQMRDVAVDLDDFGRAAVPPERPLACDAHVRAVFAIVGQFPVPQLVLEQLVRDFCPGAAEIRSSAIRVIGARSRPPAHSHRAAACPTTNA